MSRIRDPDEPKIYFLPNLMTACNLACGFFAVLMILKGQIEVQKVSGDAVLAAKQYYEVSREYYQYAILLIFGSCLFDLLDGRRCRSRFGLLRVSIPETQVETNSDRDGYEQHN